MVDAKVNQTECSRLRDACINKFQGIKEDMDIVKKALIGPDMRGGLVNQVNDLAKSVDSIKGMQIATDEHRDSEKVDERQDKKDVEQDRREDARSQKDIISRYKIAFIGIIGAAIGIIIKALIDML